jgi:hypothetical protein
MGSCASYFAFDSRAVLDATELPGDLLPVKEACHG